MAADTNILFYVARIRARTPEFSLGLDFEGGEGSPQTFMKVMLDCELVHPKRVRGIASKIEISFIDMQDAEGRPRRFERVGMAEYSCRNCLLYAPIASAAAFMKVLEIARYIEIAVIEGTRHRLERVRLFELKVDIDEDGVH